MQEITQPSRRNMDLRGEVLGGRFLLEEKLGKGGMAWVYRATHLELGGSVAIKILFPQMAEDQHIRERFLREARIQYRLQHPHIVRVLELLKEEDLIGFAAEYCEGGDLHTWLNHHAKQHTKESILRELFLPVLDAMQYAHGQGLVHRDLKPENILLSHQGKHWLPKVTDFGIAKQELASSHNLTGTGNIMGTLHYMSPEQLHETRDVDQRSDIYSLGVILYRILADRLPFEGKPTTLTLKILGETPANIAGLSEGYMKILLRCLEKEADARYPNCRTLQDALEEALLLPAFPHASSKELRNAIEALHFSPTPSNLHLSEDLLQPPEYHSLIQAETAAIPNTPPQKRRHTMQSGDTPPPTNVVEEVTGSLSIPTAAPVTKEPQQDVTRETLPLFAPSPKTSTSEEPALSEDSFLQEAPSLKTTPSQENAPQENISQENIPQDEAPTLKKPSALPPQAEKLTPPKRSLPKATSSPLSSNTQSKALPTTHMRPQFPLSSAPEKAALHPLLLLLLGATLGIVGVWLGVSWSRRDAHLRTLQPPQQNSPRKNIHTASPLQRSLAPVAPKKRRKSKKHPKNKIFTTKQKRTTPLFPTKKESSSQGPPPAWSLRKEACPDGWRHKKYSFKRQKQICLAPTNYKGPCGTKAFFSAKSDRCQWSLRCHAPWKGAGCLHPPWVFQETACPDGWGKTAYDPLRRQLYCQAPTSYRGACPRVAAFSQNALRCSWAVLCRTPWTTARCHAPAWTQHPSVCPDGWTPLRYEVKRNRIACQAPSVYKGPCARISFFTKHYSRCSWSIHCKQPWKTARCPYPDWIDQPNACPKGWKVGPFDTQSQSLTCEAPPSYKGPCSSRSAFRQKTDRCGWAVRCKVDWRSLACKYPVWLFSSYACPDGWGLVDYHSKKERATCQAPPRYNGPCSRIGFFTQYSSRCSWSKRCRVPWTSANCDF